MRDSMFLLGLLIALVVAAIFLYTTYSLAASPAFTGAGKKEIYVSDEVWYVSSARNMLRRIFHVKTHYVNSSGYEVYTIAFRDRAQLSQALDVVEDRVKSLGGDIYMFYRKVPLLAIALPKGVSPEPVVAGLSGVEEVISGYPYADTGNIHKYLNLEHPPLMKYLIGASMILFGDHPLSWRIPSMLMGAAIIVLIYVAGYRLAGLPGGLIAIILPFLDPIMRAMSSIAMLDIGLALFGAAALVAMLYRRWWLAAVMIGLAASVKFSGFFLIAALYLAMRLSGRGAGEALLVSVYVPLIPWLIVYLPVISYLGPTGWLAHLGGAVKWHTTSRPPGPPSSLPWEWIVNKNPFYMFVNPDVGAVVNEFMYIISLLMIVLSIYLADVSDRRHIYPALMITSIFAGYTAVVAAGNRTLYSYYAVFLSPLVYVQLSVPLSCLVTGPLDLKAELRAWVQGMCRCDWLRLPGWVKGRVSEVLVGKVPYPQELRFLWRSVVGEADPTLMMATLTSVLASFLIHLPSPYGPGLYSDIAAQYFSPHDTLSEALSAQLPITGILTYLLAKVSDGLGGALTFYLVSSAIIGYAVVQATQDIYALLRKRGWGARPLYLLPPSLTLIIYGVYSWTPLALALMARAMRMAEDGDTVYPSVLMAAALLINPLTIFAYIPILLRARGLEARAMSIAVYIAVVASIAAPLSFVGALGPSIDSFVYNGVEGSWLAIFMGVESQYRFIVTPILLVGLTSMAAAYMGSAERVDTFTEAAVLLALALFSSYVYKPQYTLLIYPLLLALPYTPRVWMPLIDLLNGSVIALWWGYSDIEKMLFKYSPPSPLSPYALPTMSAIMRDILLFLVTVAVIARVRAGPMGRGGQPSA